MLFSETGLCKTYKPNELLWKVRSKVSVAGESFLNRLDIEGLEFACGFRFEIFYTIVQYLIGKDTTIKKLLEPIRFGNVL